MSTSPELIDLISRDTPAVELAKLAGLRQAVPHDLVLVRESKLDRRVRAQSSTLITPAQYSVLGAGMDKLFIGDVHDVGPGVTRKDHFEGMPVEAGAVVLFNAQQLSYRVAIRGLKFYLVRLQHLAAVLTMTTDHDVVPTPIQDWILTRPAGDSILGNGITIEQRVQSHQSGGSIWLPEETDTDDVRAKHPNRHGMVACYGEVISKGPGRWRDGDWSVPLCKRGDLILFDASFGTLPIAIKGKSYTLVPAGNLSLVADRPSEVEVPAACASVPETQH